MLYGSLVHMKSGTTMLPRNHGMTECDELVLRTIAMLPRPYSMRRHQTEPKQAAALRVGSAFQLAESTESAHDWPGYVQRL